MRFEAALLVALLAVVAAPAAAGPPAPTQTAPSPLVPSPVDDSTAERSELVRPADATAGTVAPSPSSHAQYARESPHGPAQLNASTTRVEIQLRDTGDARWTVETYVPLEDEEDVAAFRELGRRFRNGTDDLRWFRVDTFRRYAAAASEASGRQMAIPQRSVERTFRVDEETDTGVLQLAFTWRSFGRVEGDTLHVDDAFRTERGTWFDGLEEGQVLVVRPPEDYTVLDAPTRVTNATIRLEGPREFSPSFFDITFQAESDPDSDPTPTPSPEPSPTPSPGSPTPTSVPPTDDGPPVALVLVVGLLAGGALVAYLLAVRGPPGDGGDPAPGGGSSAGGSAAEGTDASGAGNPGGGAAAAAEEAAHDDESGEASGEESGSEPTPEDPFAGVDVSMLSDEERVLRLLEANGGRMKQAQIVNETDWSNAKVSQLLSSMADEDQVDKLRIGRENLISLPDVDVEDFD